MCNMLKEKERRKLTQITIGVFATFTSVALAANTVHGDGKRLVSLQGDAAKAHGASGKAE